MTINVPLKPQIPVDGNAAKNFPKWVLIHKDKLLRIYRAMVMDNERSRMTFQEFASESYHSFRGEYDFDLN